MKTSTHRKVRFSTRFNWNDKNEDRGFCQISGEAMGITKLTIHYKGVDPDLDLTEHPIKVDKDDGTMYNFDNTETILFGYPSTIE